MRISLRTALLAAVIFNFGLVGPVVAQSLDDPIARCRNAGDDKARIACLETALRAIPPVSAGAPTTPAEIVPAPPETAPPVSVPVPARPVTAIVPSTPSEKASTGLGSEQIVRRKERERPNKQKSRERIEVAVQSFARNALGKWVFVLNNGQIWRQLQGDPTDPILREGQNYTASIRRGTISGYRMNIREVRSTLVVERLR